MHFIIIDQQAAIQQTESMEFQPIQPTTTADTRHGTVYIAQWSIGREGLRHAGAIGAN